MTKKQLELILEYIEQRVEDSIGATMFGSMYGLSLSRNAQELKEQLWATFDSLQESNRKSYE